MQTKTDRDPARCEVRGAGDELLLAGRFLGRTRGNYSAANQLSHGIEFRLPTADAPPLLSIVMRGALLSRSRLYDVIEEPSGRPLGVLGRQGNASLDRDTWHVRDAQGSLAGVVLGDGNEWLRRRFAFLENDDFAPDRVVPFFADSWHIESDGAVVARMKKLGRWWSLASVSLEIEPAVSLDTRLLLAAAWFCRV